MSINPFVSTEWLAAHLDDPKVVVVDASWYLPHAGRVGRAEYLNGHIPGAVFFGIDDIADKATHLPHMLPSPEAFAAEVGVLGIADTDTIVVYDEHGLYSAPRVWWTFRTMGASDVRILAGGGPKWRREGRMLQSGNPGRTPRTFNASYRPGMVASFAQMFEHMSAGNRQIADARPGPRFRAEAPEPRPGLKSGHIPGSLSVPYDTLTDTDGQLKTAAQLQDIFRKTGLDLDKPIAALCGSGVTAATLSLALETAGARDVSLYDGSWAEWAQPDSGGAVETG
mgnify:CR=1 FL=1